MTSKELQCIQAADDFRVKYARGLCGKLWAVMCRFNHRWSTPSSPKTKTVLALWHRHGIDQDEHSEYRKIRLLNLWIDILYSESASARLDIENRCSKMRQRNLKMNMPSFADASAPHFHFINPFDCVLEEVSGELPAYA